MWFAICRERQYIYIWDTILLTSARVFEFITHYQNQLFSAEFSPDGDWIICGGSNGYIYLAKSSESKIVDVIEIENSAIYSIAYSPDGTQAASCHQSGNVILWDVNMRWVEVD